MHVDERICTICDMNTTEDEAHFILHCTKYVERQELCMECRVIRHSRLLPPPRFPDDNF